MKKIRAVLIKMMLAVIRNKEKRRLLRKKWCLKANCLDMSPYYGYYSSVCTKHRQLLDNKNRIETLILGDSRAQLGILPFVLGENCFNYAFNANSNYENLQSLKYVVKNCPCLKTVIIPVAFYNGGFSLIEGAHAWKCHVLMRKFGYHMSFPKKYDFDFYESIVAKIPDSLEMFESQGYDFESLHVIEVCKKVRDRAEKHYNLFKNYTNQWKYLEEMCRLCCDNGLNLIIINHPYRSDYNEVIDECLKNDNLMKEDLIKPIKQISAEYGVHFIDYTNRGFEFEDFADCDHLNFNGALKLTKMIGDELVKNL